MTEKSIQPTTDSPHVGLRVAYVEPGVKPNGRVFLGTVCELTDDGDVYVSWDTPTVDDDAWSMAQLHRVVVA